MKNTFKIPARTQRSIQGFTLMEVMVSVGLIGIATSLAMQILVGTADGMDIETNESDMEVRTSARLYDLNSDLECASASDLHIFNSNARGYGNNPKILATFGGNPSPCIINDGAVLPGTGTGTDTGTLANHPCMGDMIAFHLCTFTGGQKLFGKVVCYYYAAMNRGGVPDPNLGMLVKEVWNDPVGNWWGSPNFVPPAGQQPDTTQVLEENLVPCNFTIYPNAPDVKLGYGYPTGFCVFQGDVETPQQFGTNTSLSTGVRVTTRSRVVTISIQRAQNVYALKKLNLLTGTLTNTDVTTSSALSQTVQTIYLKTP